MRHSADRPRAGDRAGRRAPARPGVTPALIGAVGVLAAVLVGVGTWRTIAHAEPTRVASLAPAARPAEFDRATAIWPARPERTLTLAGEVASQGVVADGTYLYGIANTGVARLDRATGAVLQTSPDRYPAADGPGTGGAAGDVATVAADRPLIHLNAGLIVGGRLYLFHSNYVSPPDRPWSGPDEGAILACDPGTLALSTVHTFGDVGGSLTWAVPMPASGFDPGPRATTGPLLPPDRAPTGGPAAPVSAGDAGADPAPHGWLCHFACYGDANDRSFLAWFDPSWREVARWTYPADLTARLDRHALSGGILEHRDGGVTLLASGHHDPRAYRLVLPAGGGPMRLVAVEEVPFDGQAFGVDPVTGGLVGIVRGRKQIVFCDAVRPAPPRLRTARP